MRDNAHPRAFVCDDPIDNAASMDARDNYGWSRCSAQTDDETDQEWEVVLS